MIKEKALRKIIISLSCLFILGILYIFPEDQYNIDSSIIYNKETDVIYLKDNNNYISRVSTILTSSNKEDKIKEIINILTIGSNKYIRDGFKKVIPKFFINRIFFMIIITITMTNMPIKNVI